MPFPVSDGRKSTAALTSLATMAALASAAHAGPVSIVSQERSVLANASAVGAASESDERSAPDAGPFDESVTAEVSGEGFLSRATASMTSTLGDDGFAFAGSLSYDVRETRSDEHEVCRELARSIREHPEAVAVAGEPSSITADTGIA